MIIVSHLLNKLYQKLVLRASCFVGGSRHLETITALGLQPRAFICFSVSEYPDESLALVFDILPKS